MLEKTLTLKLLKEKYGVCRLSAEESIPKWGKNSPFYSITKTVDELSIVCSQDCIPKDIKCEKDWRVLKIQGTLDFSLIGVISSISTILAHEKISIFAISTFDTDYILVKDKDIDKTIVALTNKNYEIVS